jgi:hypothetical protein
VFGASDTLPQQGKQWQFSLNYRGLKSDDHYNGTQFQYARKENNTYVINTQQAYDLSATYFFNDRFSTTFSVPVINASWAVPTPIAPLPAGPRAEQNASGLGDVILSGRMWLADPHKHPRGNVSIALGVKAPTGDFNSKDHYPNILTGANDTEKTVDQSAQPGDGGWGYIFDIQAYKALKAVTFYGSGTYLANPMDTNGADSVIVGLGVASPANVLQQENSVVDNYVARAGAVFPVKDSGFAFSLGARIEGLPRYDLIGDSHGFRRPGYETFIEPGFIWSFGDQVLSLYVPIGLVQNRLRNPSDTGGAAGDATFPEYVILAGFSFNFGGGGAKHAPGSEVPETPTLGTP